MVPINASGINIQLSTASPAKLDIIALRQNHLLSCGCFDFNFWNILSLIKSQITYANKLEQRTLRVFHNTNE
ncbi:hypothetical protein J6V86_02965 [bacterium]|nr:hypothetical protein [bacterium]